MVTIHEYSSILLLLFLKKKNIAERRRTLLLRFYQRIAAQLPQTRESPSSKRMKTEHKFFPCCFCQVLDHPQLKKSHFSIHNTSVHVCDFRTTFRHVTCGREPEAPKLHNALAWRLRWSSHGQKQCEQSMHDGGHDVSLDSCSSIAIKNTGTTQRVAVLYTVHAGHIVEATLFVQRISRRDAYKEFGRKEQDWRRPT